MRTITFRVLLVLKWKFFRKSVWLVESVSVEVSVVGRILFETWAGVNMKSSERCSGRCSLVGSRSRGRRLCCSLWIRSSKPHPSCRKFCGVFRKEFQPSRKLCVSSPEVPRRRQPKHLNSWDSLRMCAHLTDWHLHQHDSLHSPLTNHFISQRIA